jgi:hypothetical protein
MFDVGRWGRTSNLNVDIDARGGLVRTGEREKNSRATQRDRTKRSYFHGNKLDFLQRGRFQIFGVNSLQVCNP